MPVETLKTISSLIDAGGFDEAEKLAKGLLIYLEENDDQSDYFSILLFNLCGSFIDIGHNTGRNELSTKGVDILEVNRDRFKDIVPLHSYYYNLANAKSNLVDKKSPTELTFESIESLVSAKNYYWRAIKEAKSCDEAPPEYYVNLANCLKQQIRISESLGYYDTVISMGKQIPQAHVNRAETLMLLNMVSNSYSKKMLWDVINEYKISSQFTCIPRSYSEYYAKKAEYLENQYKDDGVTLDDSDADETDREFQRLSEYRKFCCKNHLTLSEHGLYCSCSGGARDNLTIPLGSTSLSGDYIPQMEMVLNRLKSEFSLARRNYYEYVSNFDETELVHEECFTELHNDECLGIDYEKLRSSFRICFGILDKIGFAICELYLLKPANGMVYFQNFWQLDRDGRREKFESIKTLGLLALYSIATDLNEHKNGEWKEFKKWRNSMEHGFFVITENQDFCDVYESYKFSEDIEFVQIEKFEEFVKHVLHLTRSAIFSFVFAIRERALSEDKIEGIVMELERKDFER